MTERTYTITLEHDLEEDVYVVTVPALPGCFTQGRTVEEATEHAREAIAVHLSGLVKDGEPIPEEVEPLRIATVSVAA